MPVVVIVDDDDFYKDSARSMLEASGYRVVTFERPGEVLAWNRDGEDAVCLLDSKFKTGSEREGLDVVQSVANRHPSMPVILVTKYSDYARKAKSFGACAGVEKSTLTEATILKALGEYWTRCRNMPSTQRKPVLRWVDWALGALCAVSFVLAIWVGAREGWSSAAAGGWFNAFWGTIGWLLSRVSRG